VDALTDSSSSDLNQLGEAAVAALRRQDFRAARPLFERLAASMPSDLGVWYNLAVVRRGVGDATGQLEALDKVLASEPRHLPALLMKADHFAAAGDRRAAHTFYGAAVASAPDEGRLPPHLRAEVNRAREQCALYAQAYQQHLREVLARAGFDPNTSSRRFAQSVDLLFGRKQVYLQSPTAFYFPELPQRQFYERQEFPWLAELEAKTDVIRRELLAVIDEEGAFRPYLRKEVNRPQGVLGELTDNPAWSALFLIEDGSVAAASERFPATMKALGEVPLTDAPGRTPSVLFSMLRPGVRIAPHFGHTNARLICHLPLIVPEGCGLRVGNETRPWIEGETLIFDDSMEHEAWNGGGRPRVVLLFEIWRPELSAEERRLVAATLAAVSQYEVARS